MNPTNPEDLPEGAREDIEAEIKKQYPGMEIVWAAEVPEDELPPIIVSTLDQLGAAMRDSLINGTCKECEMKMPGKWLGEVDEEEEIELAIGWTMITDPKDNPLCLLCPDCEDKDMEVLGFEE